MENQSFWDTEPHGKMLDIEGSKVTRNIEHTGWGTAFQITSLKPIPEKTINSFVFRFHNYIDTPIVVGVLQQNRKACKDSGFDWESVTYVNSHTKAKIVNTVDHEGEWEQQLYVQQGKDLTMQVDTEKNEINWRNGEVTRTTKLIQKFKGKTLFVFVSLSKQGQSVEVL